MQGLVLKLIATIHVITSYYLAEQNTVMGDSLYAGATQIDGQFQPKWIKFNHQTRAILPVLDNGRKFHYKCTIIAKLLILK